MNGKLEVIIPEDQRPVVAHINHAFFERSQTFIYHYLHSLQQFHPICIAENLLNLDQSLLPRSDIYDVAYKPFSWGGISNRLKSRPAGMNPRRARDILVKRNAQCIHAHFGPSGVLALAARDKLSIPLVTSFYGYDVSQLGRSLAWHEQYAVLFKEGDRFLVEGPFMKAQLIKLGCPEEKIKIQRIAIPLDQISFRTRSPKAQGEKVVLILCGRFVEKKGIKYALQTIARVKQRYTNFEFRIVGDGPQKPEILSLIRELKLENWVKLTGFLNYNDYLKELQAADIYLHPSRTAANGDSEGGAPTTILEAQGAGLPVVTTQHADIPNIVVPGESALLSPEGGVERLSQNLIFLMEHPDRWAHMGLAGRRFVEERHDIKKEVTGLEALYDSLIKQERICIPALSE